MYIQQCPLNIDDLILHNMGLCHQHVPVNSSAWNNYFYMSEITWKLTGSCNSVSDAREQNCRAINKKYMDAINLCGLVRVSICSSLGQPTAKKITMSSENYKVYNLSQYSHQQNSQRKTKHFDGNSMCKIRGGTTLFWLNREPTRRKISYLYVLVWLANSNLETLIFVILLNLLIPRTSSTMNIIEFART